MNKQRFFIITTIVLLLLNAVTIVYLFSNRQLPPFGGPGPADFLIKELKLDEKQQQQFEQLRQQNQQNLRNIREEDHRLHEEYFELLKTNSQDRKMADSITSLIAQQRKQTELALFDHFAQIRNICHASQQEKLNNIIDEMARRLSPERQGPPPHP